VDIASPHVLKSTGPGTGSHGTLVGTPSTAKTDRQGPTIISCLFTRDLFMEGNQILLQCGLISLRGFGGCIFAIQ